MKKLLSALVVILLSAVLTVGAAADINKNDMVSGKWTVLSDGILSTVAVNSDEHSSSVYTLRISDFTSDSFDASYSCYVPQGSSDYSAMLFGSRTDGLFTGIAFMLSQSGLTISEFTDGQISVSIIPSNSYAAVLFADENGDYCFNSIQISCKSGVFNMSVNGTDAVSEYRPTNFQPSGSVYAEACVDTNIPICFKDFSLFSENGDVHLFYTDSYIHTDNSAPEQNISSESSSVVSVAQSSGSSAVFYEGGVGGGGGDDANELDRTSLFITAVAFIGTAAAAAVVATVLHISGRHGRRG